MKAILFPGQGSQVVGMGSEFYNNFSSVKEIFNSADEKLKFKLSKIILEGPEDQLKLTQNTQPAILTVSYAIFKILKEEFNYNFENTKYFAGHSLGEYSALLCAGSLSFEDALYLLFERGKSMQEVVPVGKGGMLAVLGSENKEIEDCIKKIKSKGVCKIANDNAPGQIIVSGNIELIQELQNILKENKKPMPLNELVFLLNSRSKEYKIHSNKEHNCFCANEDDIKVLKITPNLINFLMLGLGIILHGSFKKFTNAIGESISDISGILIQFPLYFGIMGIMSSSGMVTQVSNFFVSISSATTLPLVTFFSAGLVNIFVPSGGGQWVIQGPIIIESALKLGVPLEKAIMALAYGDQITNMLQPFWALPLLGITKLKAKEILPYSLIAMFVGSLIYILGILLF